MNTAIAFLGALRPKQWTKNLLLFAGIVFSQHFLEPELLLRATAGFFAFSLVAGCVYVVNDVRDIEADRLHPKKRRRSIASGRISRGTALGLALPVFGVAVVISLWLGSAFSLVLAAYVVMQVAYSLFLKNQVLIDVFVIAIGFVLRALAGVELLRPVVPDVQISAWLLVCTFFGALFIASGKRRRELQNAGDQASNRRTVLGSYTPELLDGLLVVTAASSIMSYALYTIWPATVAKFGTEALLYTVPFVTYGIFRYLHLIQVSETSEDPSLVLLVDRPLASCVVLYAVAVALILYRP